MNIYFSSGAFQSSSLAEIVATCADLGLERLELSSGIKPSAALVQEIESAKRMVPHLLVHNYFPPPAAPFVLNLASTDEKTLSLSKNLVRTAIDLSAELGAPFYSVHSGFALNIAANQLGDPDAQAKLSPVSYERAYEIFGAAVSDLSGYARVKGLKLLIENNVVTSVQVGSGKPNPLLMTRPDETSQFLRELNDGNVGLLLDVGHAKVAAPALGFDPAGFFELPIDALHLSDNDGIRDNNQPFDRSAWFAPFLKEHAETPQVIEVYRLTCEQMLRQRAVLEELG